MTAYMERADKRVYTAAGEQLQGFAPIAVASNVELPDGDADVDERVRYRAERDDGAARRGMPVLWAAALIALAVAVMFSLSMQARNRTRAYHAELDQLRTRLHAIALERAQLESDIAAACDRAKICYHAARELGMQLAVDSQTIQVIAPPTRAAAGAGQTAASLSAGGMR